MLKWHEMAIWQESAQLQKVALSRYPLQVAAKGSVKHFFGHQNSVRVSQLMSEEKC